ncbi:MAG: class I SAM-dependent methyltransferase [Planctomycetes bacterium]|nr:class I SAM-dependent methyltransferase [Planctomycetota bacterium]
MSKSSTPEREAPPCDCCGASAWEYEFTEANIDLGRCVKCGLHYVAKMPIQETRTAETRTGLFDHDHHIASAKIHISNEEQCESAFQGYLDLVQRFAPPGKMLDIGCGTGTAIRAARQCGIEAEGIELTSDRLELARKLTGATIHDQPIEKLGLAPGSFAAITLFDVFSHLASPTEAFSHMHRALCPDGIVLLRTGEFGAGLRKHHNYLWDLGDHLYFLGDHTIKRYAEKTDFELIYRETAWRPALIYTRDRFKRKGRSALRNFLKSVCVYTPGVFPLMRSYMLKKKHVGNPCYHSTLVLRKVGRV